MRQIAPDVTCGSAAEAQASTCAALRGSQVLRVCTGEAAAAGAAALVIADRSTNSEPDPSHSELQPRQVGRLRSVRRAPGREISRRQRAAGASKGGRFWERPATTTIRPSLQIGREAQWKSYPTISPREIWE